MSNFNTNPFAKSWKAKNEKLHPSPKSKALESRLGSMTKKLKNKKYLPDTKVETRGNKRLIEILGE